VIEKGGGEGEARVVPGNDGGTYLPSGGQPPLERPFFLFFILGVEAGAGAPEKNF